ncbi:hypothetical protein Vi05172_g10853 [Venturia inaequalis]|nr:hypothetical protein Vi05172_g10853 [Venturia inaequalis]
MSSPSQPHLSALPAVDQPRARVLRQKYGQKWLHITRTASHLEMIILSDTLSSINITSEHRESDMGEMGDSAIEIMDASGERPRQNGDIWWDDEDTKEAEEASVLPSSPPMRYMEEEEIEAECMIIRNEVFCLTTSDLVDVEGPVDNGEDENATMSRPRLRRGRQARVREGFVDWHDVSGLSGDADDADHEQRGMRDADEEDEEEDEEEEEEEEEDDEMASFIVDDDEDEDGEADLGDGEDSYEDSDSDATSDDGQESLIEDGSDCEEQ